MLNMVLKPLMQSPFDITAFLQAALAEDIGAGDITGNALVPADLKAKFNMNARSALVVCGLKFLPKLFALIDPSVKVELLVGEGARVTADVTIARLHGPARALLAGERTALNLVQHLSGVATLTRRYVDAVAGTNAKIYDTRKTIPGLRHLQKYAVTCGGGNNHRMGLYDAVLIKDNHLALSGSVAAAVSKVRGALSSPSPLGGGSGRGRYDAQSMPSVAPHLTSPRMGEEKTTIIVECDTLAQVDQAIAAKVDIILLDNMDNTMLREAVARIQPHGIQTEASGNVSLETVRAIAQTGVDRISIGKLTHSVSAVDIGLDEVGSGF